MTDIVDSFGPQGARVQEILLSGLDSLRDGVQIVDNNFYYTYLNKAAERHARRPRAELIGRTMMDCYPGIERTEMFQRLRHALSEQCVETLDNEFVYPDGVRAWFNLRIEPIPGGLFILSLDVTQRVRAERELLRLNRALTALSECNQLLVRSTDEAELIRALCRVIVERAGYPLVWVGLRESDSLVLGGAHGLHPASSETAHEHCLAAARGEGPAGSALLSPRASRARPTREGDAERDRSETQLGSVLAMPIAHEGKTLGVISIHSDDPDAFDARECALLDEMALDMGYGIAMLRARQRQDETTNALRRVNRRLSALSQAISGLAEARSESEAVAIASEAAKEVVSGDVAWCLYEQTSSFATPVRAQTECLQGIAFESARCLPCLQLAPDEIASAWRSGTIRHVGCLSAWATHHRKALVANHLVPTAGMDPQLAELRAVAAVPTLGEYPRVCLVAGWSQPTDPPEEERLALATIAHAASVTIRNTFARRELERREAHNRAVFENLPDPTFVWRHDGCGYTLDELNERACALARLERDALIGQRLSAVADRVPPLLDALEECRATGAVVRREITYRALGSHSPTTLSLSVDQAQSNVFVVCAADITRQRQIERQLELAQRLEAIGQLAAGLAHDMNNLLSVVISYAELAAEQLEESPLRDDLREIHFAGMRGVELVKHLLEFSSAQPSKPVIVDLNRSIVEADAMLRRTLSEEIELSVELAPDLGSVRVDATQISQLVMNLAINARDAMPDGGRISISTANVTLDENIAMLVTGAAPGPYVELRVSDNGHGMDESTQQRIFEPFFTTKPDGRGTGLGLATVYGIVRQCNGHISVYSEPGAGTTFKIYLPRCDERAHVSETQSGPLPRGSETILLVEDDDAVRLLARRILESAGYTVLPAKNGGEALVLWRQHRDAIALVVSDRVMPRMRGTELAAKLLAERPELRVLLMSGYIPMGTDEEATQTRRFPFLPKPFSADALRRKVHELLEQPAEEH